MIWGDAGWVGMTSGLPILLWMRDRRIWRNWEEESIKAEVLSGIKDFWRSSFLGPGLE